MTCREIEERLSAYLDDALPAEERRKVEEHLASCPSCARVLADLRKTVGLVRGLGEVEPPPWLKQKIMTRVREDAAPKKKGILKTLFFPLHIKVPIQAFAMVLIAVLAFQVYRTGEPERQALDLPLPPARVEQKAAAPGAAPGIAEPAPVQESRREGAKAERPMRGTAPSTAEPATGRPQAEPFRSRPQAVEEKGLGFAPPPGHGAEPGHAGLDRSPPAAVRKLDADASGQSAPGGKSQVQGPAAEALREAGGGGPREAATVRQKAANGFKRKDRPGASALAAKGERPAAGAPQRKSAAPAPIADIVLRATDTSTAAAGVERQLRASGAGNIHRRAQQGGTLITADLPEIALTGLIERLRTLGDLLQPGSTADADSGTIAVRIRIITDEK